MVTSHTVFGEVEHFCGSSAKADAENAICKPIAAHRLETAKALDVPVRPLLFLKQRPKNPVIFVSS